MLLLLMVIVMMMMMMMMMMTFALSYSKVVVPTKHIVMGRMTYFQQKSAFQVILSHTEAII